MRTPLISLGLLLLASCASGARSEVESPNDGAGASSSAAAPADEWRSVEPVAGVSVLMPGAPEDLGSAAGSALLGVKTPAGGAFTAMCMSLGDGPTDEALAGMRRGKIGDRKLLSEKKYAERGLTGVVLEIELETTKGRFVSHELLVGSKRSVACAFTALVPDGVDAAKDIERFFGSVKME